MEKQETKIQNLSINMGEINTLKVMRDTDFGFFLESKDGDEVLLPNVYVMEWLRRKSILLLAKNTSCVCVWTSRLIDYMPHKR